MQPLVMMLDLKTCLRPIDKQSNPKKVGIEYC